MGGAIVAVTFDEHIIPFTFGDVVKQQRVPAASPNYMLLLSLKHFDRFPRQAQKHVN
jgi:hypothetical protein